MDRDIPQRQIKAHGKLQAESPLSPYRAFVVQFRVGTDVKQERYAGRVEHVVSGQATHLHLVKNNCKRKTTRKEGLFKKAGTLEMRKDEKKSSEERGESMENVMNLFGLSTTVLDFTSDLSPLLVGL